MLGVLLLMALWAIGAVMLKAHLYYSEQGLPCVAALCFCVTVCVWCAAIGSSLGMVIVSLGRW